MKKAIYMIFIFAFALSVNAIGQRPVIELTLTAKYQMQHVPLDSIYIQNLTQPGDTMLYAPDTVLLLDYIIGIPDFPGNVMSSFSVSPNYPNPSADGRTSIDVFIPAKETVTMRVFNISGNEVAIYDNMLDAGNHHFTFLAGKEKYYVLSVNCGNETRSVKMINAGNNPQNQCSLIYGGSFETEPSFKSQNEIAGFGFSLGDQLRFIGYAKSPLGFAGSDVIEASPEGSENYVFEILEGLPCPGIPTVFYEGKTYKTVLIGTQCWFKQNLNVGVMIDVTQAQTNNSVMEKYCYNNDQSNCDVYGGLYQWNELMQYTTTSGAQGLCPEGWHVTTNDEWTTLTTFLGGVEVAGGKMKETGTIHWNSPNEGATNESGFTGLPGGIRMSIGAFSGMGGNGTWWSSTIQSSNLVYDRSLNANAAFVSGGTFIDPMGLSARCLYEETFVTTPTVSTADITEIGQTNATGGGEVTSDGGAEVTARGVCWSTSQNPTIADSHTEDGTGTGVFISNLTGLTPNTPYYVRAYVTNSVGTAYGNEVTFTTLYGSFTCGDVVSYEGQDYNTIQMGTQCWFLDNLNVGTMVTENQTNNGVVEKYCYDNDPANCEIYGGLYDWGEVMQYSTQPGIQAICPTGWHIPTDEEFTAFTDYISSQPEYLCNNSSFNNAKAIATNTGWDTSSEYCAVGNDPSANNASGFSGMPVGIRMDNGSGFDGVGNTTAWYSSTESSGFAAKGRMIASDYSFILTSMMSKNYGMSVRCLKDQLNVPTATTSAITDITQISAVGGGEVTADGGAEVTARGVCWSTSQNPTIADSHTVDGSGLGTFVSLLTYLSPNTLYFVRAYATNSVGTAYGNEVNFTTLAGSFTCGDVVSYEGQDYNTIQMGTQCWFLDNLNVGIMVTENQTNNGVIEKYCYDNDPANCEIYGGLYDWGEVMQYSTQPGIQAICPMGWHIPTDEEFTIFTSYISSQPEYLCDNSSFNNAKAIATSTGWDTSSEYCAVGNDPSANNASGFSGMPVGIRMDNGSGFDGVGNTTAWYSSTESSGFAAQGRMLATDYWFILTSMMSKNYGMSVRCLKDQLNVPTVTTAAITDITQISAVGGGEVTADGGAEVTARGVCWSTSQNPTIADSHTEDGNGTGVYVSNLTGLTLNTPYFVRAYATNSVGTAYGNEVNFTTLSGTFTCGASLTITHVAGDVAPVDKTTTYGTVTNIPGETSKCWMTSNLGSDHQATSVDDGNEASAGWYWQFNRKQGYKHDGTIRTPNTAWDWNIIENIDWQAANDPCTLEIGSGWRIPTSTEWINVDAGGNWTDWNGPWNSGLKMHASGRLRVDNGGLDYRGEIGQFWSSSTYGSTQGGSIWFASSLCVGENMEKGFGFTLRCIKDIPACGTIITVNHQVGEVAPVNKTVTYGTVTNIPGETSKCWITSNLGSDHQATSVDDATEASAGWYWQFNRKQGYKHDGTTRIPNTVWLNNINENSDWLFANDPCGIELGTGWRVPSATEWINVMTADNWVNWNGPWNSDLKLHAAGSLLYNNGDLDSRGYVGLYNSSTQNNVTEAYSMGFDFQSMIVGVAPKTSGFTMRCIKDSFTCGTSFTISHEAGEVAPVDKTTNYGTVTNIPGETSKCWITSNLGSDHQATAVTDDTEASAGWYWQFNHKQGYKHDGTIRTPNSSWIPGINENADWLADNDPCILELGNGWRLPTMTEWANVFAAGNWTNYEGPWSSDLKLHSAGFLSTGDGGLNSRGSYGSFWSNVKYTSTEGYDIYFNISNCGIAANDKAYGFSVRCIKE